MNAALARAASEERKRRKLEEAERIRLEAEAKKLEQERNQLADQAQDLANYKSEFFGRLREILAGQEGVKIVGDRFVFSSEVLFEPGAASLSEAGQLEIDKVANILLGVKDSIPDTIEWVIRVDGHTDNIPCQAQVNSVIMGAKPSARIIGGALYGRGAAVPRQSYGRQWVWRVPASEHGRYTRGARTE